MVQAPTNEKQNDEDRFFLVGSSLSDEEKKEMVSFLRTNIDMFAWQPYDMSGTDAEVIYPRLHIDKKN